MPSRGHRRGLPRRRVTPRVGEGEDVAADRELARTAARCGLDPEAAVAAAYSAERFERIREIRREAEAAGVRGVPQVGRGGPPVSDTCQRRVRDRGS